MGIRSGTLSSIGLDYINGTFIGWAWERGLALEYIPPRKSHQDGYVERHNRIVSYDRFVP